MCTSRTPQYEFNNLLQANEYLFQIWSESTAEWSNSSPILCFITAPEVAAQPDTVELLKIPKHYTNALVKHPSTTLYVILHRYTLGIHGNRDYSLLETLF